MARSLPRRLYDAIEKYEGQTINNILHRRNRGKLGFDFDTESANPGQYLAVVLNRLVDRGLIVRGDVEEENQWSVVNRVYRTIRPWGYNKDSYTPARKGAKKNKAVSASTPAPVSVSDTRRFDLVITMTLNGKLVWIDPVTRDELIRKIITNL